MVFRTKSLQSLALCSQVGRYILLLVKMSTAWRQGAWGELLFLFAPRLLSFVLSNTLFWFRVEFIKLLVILVVDSWSLLRRFLLPRIGVFKFSTLTILGCKS